MERSPRGWAILTWIAIAPFKRNPIAKACQCKQKARAQPRKPDCQRYATPEDCLWHRTSEKLDSYEGIEGLWHYSSNTYLSVGLPAAPWVIDREQTVKVLIRLRQLCSAELYYLP